MPGVHGTRDTFGIGKEFYDHKTGKWIDNRKSWERAGYSDIREFVSGDSVLEPVVKEKLKEQKHKKPLPKDFNMEGLK